MKIILIIILLLVLGLIIKTRKFSVQKSQKDDEQASNNIKKTFPNREKVNDKLVMVKGVGYSDLKKAIQDCCKMYNKQGNEALPRVFKISENDFAITFPYDIEFELYCYFINYLKYPIDITYTSTVTAWTTTNFNDEWITEKTANKKVMLFIPEDDTENDNVFLTTADNTGYKLGFAVTEEKQLLATPKQHYVSPPIGLDGLVEKQYEDIR